MKGKRVRLIGLPGTGKTTRLLEYLDSILKLYPPHQIIYCSYSNAAVQEAIDRVSRKFSISKEGLRYFRTMHSLCFGLLKNNTSIDIELGSKPAQTRDFENFLNKYLHNKSELVEYLDDLKIYATTQMYVSHEEKEDAISYYTLGTNPPKFFLNIFNFMYATFGTTPSTNNNFGQFLPSLKERIGLPKRYFSDMYTVLLEMENNWKEYKKENDLFEFEELLYQTYNFNIFPNAKILIVDEYQDSSRLQAKLVDRWAEQMDRTIVAGDPNQAIYGFNGASPRYLENFKADHTELLHKTWRVPKNGVEYAKKILNNQWTEQMVSSSKNQGEVVFSAWGDIHWEKYESVFVLGRTGSILERARNELAEIGVINSLDGKMKVKQIYSLYYNYIHQNPIPITDIFEIKTLFPTFFSSQIQVLINKMIEQEKTIQEMRGENYKTTELDSVMVETILGFKRKEELHQLSLKQLNQKDKIFYKKAVKADFKPVMKAEDAEKIKFMTFHTSKGKEADCVILLSSPSWYEKEGRIDESEERRVYFVAATRTKGDLFIVDLQEDKENQGEFTRTQFLPHFELKSSIVTS